MEEKPHRERITDPDFKKAVYLLDTGEEDALSLHLSQHPRLVSQHVHFEKGYFENPTLLQFVAENPIRNGKLPANIVAITKIILEAGAKSDLSQVDYTLGLVCSGCVSREFGVQIPLINLLCDYGAKPDWGMRPALVHGELEAAEEIIKRGAVIDLPVAAAMGNVNQFNQLLPGADSEQRHLALAFAAQHGYTALVKTLLVAGEDPNRYNPEGAHGHSTPLHQAVVSGHEQVVRLLAESGARTDIKDKIFEGTPLDWAEYAHRDQIAGYLRDK